MSLRHTTANIVILLLGALMIANARHACAGSTPENCQASPSILLGRYGTDPRPASDECIQFWHQIFDKATSRVKTKVEVNTLDSFKSSLVNFLRFPGDLSLYAPVIIMYGDAISWIQALQRDQSSVARYCLAAYHSCYGRLEGAVETSMKSRQTISSADPTTVCSVLSVQCFAQH